MISKNFLLSTCLALGLAATAMANNVVSTGQWHAPVAPSESGDTFYSNLSRDGSQCNVGYWLASTDWDTAPTCGGSTTPTFESGSGGPGNLSFLAAADPTQNVGWEFVASNSQSLSLLLEVAGNHGGNSLGWYTVGPGNVRQDQGLLIVGGDAPITVAPITVAADTQFGFYICPNGVCANAFYSGDGPGAGGGKFALFSETPSNPGPGSAITTYWVGVEDLVDSYEGIGDFNDMLFRASVVPEPGFYAALALGLFGVFFYTWRRRQQQAENN